MKLEVVQTTKPIQELEKIKQEQIEIDYLVYQNSQQQNPCEFDECPQESFYTVKDHCLGIPITMDLCRDHYREWEDMKLGKD